MGPPNRQRGPQWTGNYSQIHNYVVLGTDRTSAHRIVWTFAILPRSQSRSTSRAMATRSIKQRRRPHGCSRAFPTSDLDVALVDGNGGSTPQRSGSSRPSGASSSPMGDDASEVITTDAVPRPAKPSRSSRRPSTSNSCSRACGHRAIEEFEPIMPTFLRLEREADWKRRPKSGQDCAQAPTERAASRAQGVESFGRLADAASASTRPPPFACTDQSSIASRFCPRPNCLLRLCFG